MHTSSWWQQRERGCFSPVGAQWPPGCTWLQRRWSPDRNRSPLLPQTRGPANGISCSRSLQLHTNTTMLTEIFVGRYIYIILMQWIYNFNVKLWITQCAFPDNKGLVFLFFTKNYILSAHCCPLSKKHELNSSLIFDVHYLIATKKLLLKHNLMTKLMTGAHHVIRAKIMSDNSLICATLSQKNPKVFNL